MSKMTRLIFIICRDVKKKIQLKVSRTCIKDLDIYYDLNSVPQNCRKFELEQILAELGKN